MLVTDDTYKSNDGGTPAREERKFPGNIRYGNKAGSL